MKLATVAVVCDHIRRHRPIDTRGAERRTQTFALVRAAGKDSVSSRVSDGNRGLGAAVLRALLSRSILYESFQNFLAAVQPKKHQNVT